MSKKELIVIAGPTGIGKTALGIEIARELNTEIISADSRQIYREMSIGTAVPSKKQLRSIPHHFIQNISIHDYYNASKYENEVLAVLDILFQKYNRVLLVGGSGMYIDAIRNGIDELPETDMNLRNKLHKQLEEEGLESLCQQLEILDPESYKKIDLKNPKRVQKALEISIMTGKPYSSFLGSPKKERNFNFKLLALDMNREELYSKINRRVLGMIEEGLVKEAEGLLKFRNNNALNTLGYKEIFHYLDGNFSLDEAVRKIQDNSRKYARKQLTWFRKNGEYSWFNPNDIDGIMKFILQDV